MILLIVVTLLWAFSFSLIGEYLSGNVDAYFSVFSRVFLATLLFLPLLRPSLVSLRTAVKLTAVGGIQLGLMYIFYYNSFLLLSVPEVLVFTIFTPIYVTLIYDLLNRQFTPWYFLTALLAVIGAGVIRYQGTGSSVIPGFLVVQASNICFAFGQVAYKKIITSGIKSLPQAHIFGYFYLGALLVTLCAWITLGKSQYPTQPHQWIILFWLGLGASGLGYFLWNRGATQVNVGFLAIMNNALIPAGLVVNILIWNRDTEISRLIGGGMIILFSLVVNQWVQRKRSKRFPLSS